MSLDAFMHILGWSAVINIAVLGLSTVALIFLNGPVASLQAKLFGLTPEQCRLEAYRYLATYKALFLVFNLVPYLALRLVISA
ncbi:DUF6868 family protein [Marinagarivorans cellulosilyticus]|uniref:DUF6868 domain-containing protein n=1 Tax=Marinagarivorans cellulosilyticus TaxID=2721545 RepID=A0AAN1WLG5_9GAMM|nr:hypothetical protein [Marinagarivorans cellulosilyticus]BCD99831.1 hypothetical protein MARGE09_P4033 [Marinagarivorans cellulosilyticus]